MRIFLFCMLFFLSLSASAQDNNEAQIEVGQDDAATEATADPDCENRENEERAGDAGAGVDENSVPPDWPDPCDPPAPEDEPPPAEPEPDEAVVDPDEADAEASEPDEEDFTPGEEISEDYPVPLPSDI